MFIHQSNLPRNLESFPVLNTFLQERRINYQPTETPLKDSQTEVLLDLNLPGSFKKRTLTKTTSDNLETPKTPDIPIQYVSRTPVLHNESSNSSTGSPFKRALIWPEKKKTH